MVSTMSVTHASFTAFMLLTALPAWLSRTRPERERISEETLGAALGRHPGISMRFFDAEAFSGRCSDVAMFTTDDLSDYYVFVEELRDGPLFTVPYFKVEDVILTIEDGHKVMA
jgi:hypothetical protein